MSRTETAEPPSQERSRLPALVLGALGVVYGDIGTSPLYAVRECFLGEHGLPLTGANVLGILSLIFWSLLLVISLKYLVFVMRADNRGEGGILALMALVARQPRDQGWRLLALGLFGAALLYADGMITPAISVLSAVEGLRVATPLFQPYVLPLSTGILVVLFLVQHHGTGRIGIAFGPIVLVWFAAIGIAGAVSIAHQPGVLLAADPRYALRFFAENGWLGFGVLGAVFLVVTGGEALYADMGHFGKRPIQIGWFFAALPALLLNYFGQGALLLRSPEALPDLFYRMVPSWALYPQVILATAATIIASQAVISGTFSLTRQAVQLGYSPRLAIRQTSSSQIGQVYLPSINYLLMAGTIGLLLGFRESGNLAAAYGVAVSTTMLITTLFLFRAARRVWGWSPWAAWCLVGLFLVPDLAFFTSNLIKIESGGWLPLLLAGLIYTLMATWEQGRSLLRAKIEGLLLPEELFLRDIENRRRFDLSGLHLPPEWMFLGDMESRRLNRVSGTAVFLTGNPVGIPVTLLHNFKHNKVLHETIALLTVQTAEVPYVNPKERVEMKWLGDGLHRLTLRYGFSESPDVPAELDKIKTERFRFELRETTFFVGSEALLVPRRSPSPMPYWRRKLFALMSHHGWEATKFFKIPPNRVVVLGLQIEL